MNGLCTILIGALTPLALRNITHLLIPHSCCCRSPVWILLLGESRVDIFDLLD